MSDKKLRVSEPGWPDGDAELHADARSVAAAIGLGAFSALLLGWATGWWQIAVFYVMLVCAGGAWLIVSRLRPRPSRPHSRPSQPPQAAERREPTAAVEPAKPAPPVPAPAEAAGGVEPVFDPQRAYVNLLEQLPIALGIADREGRLLFANDAFCSVTAVDLTAHTAYAADMVMVEDRTAVSDMMRRVGAGVSSTQHLVVHLRNRPEEPTQITAARTAGDPDPVVLLTVTDNSEKRRLEQQFAQVQKMQAVGQLAGGIAHDFNNILTAIIGFGDLLLQRHPPGDASFADIQQILHNANRAAQLVKQLLAFSRQQTLRPTVVHVTDLISEQMTTLKRLIGEKIFLEVVHARDLGLVRVDTGQFYQVMLNLVVNARDALPDGGTISIRTRTVKPEQLPGQGSEIMPREDFVAIDVADTGTGIPPEVLPKIFDPFFTTKDVGKGTGLGLSTVYGIVKQSNGYIFVESTVGKGTVFSVYLPVFAATEGGVGAVQPVVVEDLWGHATILLVEDEDAVRTFAAKALENKGYKVLSAASGEEALDLFHTTQTPIDLVVSDVVMPQMDGPALAKQLRALKPDIKIIFVSGYAEETLRKSIDTPDVAFLPKPFSLKELAAAVKRALEAQ